MKFNLFYSFFWGESKKGGGPQLISYFIMVIYVFFYFICYVLNKKLIVYIQSIDFHRKKKMPLQLYVLVFFGKDLCFLYSLELSWVSDLLYMVYYHFCFVLKCKKKMTRKWGERVMELSFTTLLYVCSSLLFIE